MEKYFKERENVANMMARLYNRGLTTVSGGNISLRLNEELFCITPSALDKSCLTPDLIAIVGMDGTNYTPNLKLSIESEIHRKLLINRPDINAVVHSHPVYASTFSAVPLEKSPINLKITAETYYFIPEVYNVSYSIMGSKELAKKVSEAGRTHNVMLMQNHGAIALGSTLLKAFDTIDLLERAARMTIISKEISNLGLDVKDLNDEQCDQLKNL